MKRAHLTMKTLFPFLFILIMPNLVGFAPGNQFDLKPASVTNDQSNLLVVLMIDDSGSMADNDSKHIRYAAARLFISLLDPGDQVAVIRFASESRFLTDGVVEISDGESQQKLIQQVQPEETDGYTDMLAAFEMADGLLRKNDLAATQVVFVLLTDGKPKIEQPYASYESDILNLIAELGAPVLPVAFTQNAQSSFLYQIANLTGEQIIYAAQANDLVGAYLEVFSKIKDRLVVKIESPDPSESILFELNPTLAPFVQRISFVAVGPGELIVRGPDDQLVSEDITDGAEFLNETRHYQAITIENPAGGEWTFERSGGHQGLYAVLRTRLRLDVELLYSTHPAGEPLLLTAQITEEDFNGDKSQIIGDANISATITDPQGYKKHLDRFYDDGTHGDHFAGDGIYSRLHFQTDQVGEYQIQVEGWKGLVPLEAQTKVMIADFPGIVIDSLTNPQYEIREQPVEIRAHLSIGQTQYQEAPELTAIISTPSQQIIEIPLPAQDGFYSGEFIPTEEGQYLVEILIENDTYLGVPYSDREEVSFDVKIIPTIRIAPKKSLTITAEISHLQAGLPLVFEVFSTSTEPENLNLALDGLSGFSLADTAALTIPPGVPSQAKLALVPDGSTIPGLYTGKIKFMTNQDIDIENGEHEIEIRVVQPTLNLPASIDLSSPCTCASWQETITIPITSTSLISENLALAVDSSLSLEIEPDHFLIKPGPQYLTLTIHQVGNLKPGSYQFDIDFIARDGLIIEPDGTISLDFEVQPWWVCCKKLLIQTGLGLGVCAFVTLRTVKKIRKHRKPPIVTGLIRVWPTGKKTQAQEIDLTALQKPTISLGSSPEADCTLSGQDIEPFHIEFRAIESSTETRIELVPLVTVQIGYRTCDEPFTIEHSDTIQIGDRSIQYLSDEGF